MVSGGCALVHASHDIACANEKNELCYSNANGPNFQTSCNEAQDGIFVMEDLAEGKEENIVCCSLGKDLVKDRADKPSVQSIELAESAIQPSEVNIIQSNSSSENDDRVVQKKFSALSGVKRPRSTDAHQGPSLCILYNSLPRCSKKKLEELIHQWSQWHAHHCSSTEESVELLESGEETYFPALHVGSDKSVTMSFWMDNVRKRQHKESVLVDKDCTPVYNREYGLALSSDAENSKESTRDLREDPRCFNCASYNHSLNECPKPRDNASVNNARKEYLGKKSQNACPRVPTRYYQQSPRGKYDGLKPGILSQETRKSLGLQEFDPPPWLHRMRELGYPPGYLEDDDQPSGITIFGDEELGDSVTRNNLTAEVPKSNKKMSVDFPGINAPIPENADQNCWAASQAPPSSDLSEKQPEMKNAPLHDQWRLRSCHESPVSHYSSGCPPPPIPSYSENHFGYNPAYSRQQVGSGGISIPVSSIHGRPRHYNYGNSHSYLRYDYGRPLHYDYGRSPSYSHTWNAPLNYGSSL